MATIVHLLGVENLRDLTSEQYNLLVDVLKFEMRSLAWDRNTPTSQALTVKLQDALDKIKANK